ncbi:hypothetical protein A8709_10985 [Paenibacillus pectinilyticus]|uniref:HTH araC/xylS-type domain-containing protein n=1 Tax=Paenibacillus pectinilyticus TaxID=512399 RepID=A0A1C1A2E1_9BACL|nr:AraC family transcriptional regulator [Paenibacillus pectinilyticus]OCT14699.1 hypothetical protein A8709_10985 [Paenibacillus pectinilyticus]
MISNLEFLYHTKRFSETYIPMHQHSCYELVYYQSGSGTTCLAEIDYRYDPNTFTLIRPGTWHDERHTVDTDVLFIGFQIHNPSFQLSDGMLVETPDYKIKGLLHNIHVEFQNKRPHYHLQLDLLLSTLIIELKRMQHLSESNAKDDKLIYVRNYINEHFKQKLHIETLASMADYSYDRFRHLFKETYGVSPGEYILSKRIKHASELLRHTHISITSIALECGFSTDAQFCTLFKRELGQTPRTYRNLKSVIS